jgi:hypothetical protein
VTHPSTRPHPPRYHRSSAQDGWQGCGKCGILAAVAINHTDRRAQPVPRAEVSPTLFLLAGLMGAWVAHNLEYFRVWGISVFPSSVSRSAHLYLGPAGIVLVLTALGAVHSSFRAARRLECRLNELRRGSPVAADDLRSNL